MGSAAANTALENTNMLTRDVEALDARVASLERVIKPVPTFWAERRRTGIKFSVGETTVGEAHFSDGLTRAHQTEKMFQAIAKAVGAKIKGL